jgi:uncharacterized protein YjbI with pentapeptide repeats
MRIRDWLPWGIVLVVIALGLFLWCTPGATADRNSELGAALLGGGVVSIALLYLQWRLSLAAEKRDLQLQLGIQKDFRGIDLSARDLSGFHLPEKYFTKANFTRANLKGVNLSGAILSQANLNGADLRGAKLDKTALKPRVGQKPSETQRPTIYKDVSINGTTFDKAKYDSKTSCPEGLDLRARGAIEVKPWWRRIFGA